MIERLPAPAVVILDQPIRCPACHADLGTPAGIAKHNIHAALNGERVYPNPPKTYVG